MTIQRSLTRRDVLRTGALGVGAAALGAGLRRAPAAAQQGGKLRIYWNAGHNYTPYQKVIEEFKKDHPGWDVSMELYQWPDMRTKILADFAAGNPPDLSEEPGGWVQEFALAGNLKSLKDYIAADGEKMGFPNDWLPYPVERNTVNGEVYGVQLHLTCVLLFYNQNMFDKAGITKAPTTWEEFLDVAKETTQGSTFGFAPNQNSDYSWPWNLQNGVTYYDPEKNVVPMDNDAAYEALQYQADLIHKYKVAPVPIASADYEGPQKLFSAKRAAMILTGPWDIKPIQDGSPDVKWSLAQDLTRKIQSTISAGTSMMIPKDAKNPDLAWDLMKRFTALDVELAVTKEASQTMPRKSWAEQAEVKSNELIAPFAQGLTYAVDWGAKLRVTGHWGEINDLYDKAYQEIIYQNQPASKSLKDFVDKANKILASK
jgi:multiple sugar transport system substrate-binding protein